MCRRKLLQDERLRGPLTCSDNAGKRAGTPKGFCNKAQGCEQRATLGNLGRPPLSTSKRLRRILVWLEDTISSSGLKIRCKVRRTMLYVAIGGDRDLNRVRLLS